MVEEPYFLVLDGLMMFLGCFFLLLAHPGFIFKRTVLSVVHPERSVGLAKIEPLDDNVIPHSSIEDQEDDTRPPKKTWGMFSKKEITRNDTQ